MEIFWVVLIVQGIVFGGFCSFIATQKNRDSGGWFFLGFFFSLLAVLALIAIPKDNSSNQSNIYRVCPYCAEDIKVQATICRFCQKELPQLEHNKSESLIHVSVAELDLDESYADLKNKIIEMRREGFSYYLIAEDFNEKNIPIPESNTAFESWTPELVQTI